VNDRIDNQVIRMEKETKKRAATLPPDEINAD